MSSNGIIEVGSDGAFDISEPPPPPPRAAAKLKANPSPAVKPPTPPKSTEREESKAASSCDWALKKERGNKAFKEGNLEFAVECYTAALDSISVRCP